MPTTASKPFETRTLGAAIDATAPDGTAVRLLLSLAGGSMAHFELPAGAVSHAVTHRTVEEIWFVRQRTGQHLAPPGRRRSGSTRLRPARRSPSHSERRFSFAPRPAGRSLSWR